MPLNESANKLRKMINKAIEDEKISHAEMDAIIAMANEDGHIDSQERALLNQLQTMIENKDVRYIM